MNQNLTQQRGFASISDVEEFSRSLTGAMDDLTEVIEAETDLVRAGKLVAATSLQPKKSQHAEAYITLVNRAKAHAPAIRQLSPSMAESLASAQSVFKSTLQINMAALATAREVSENLIKGVAKNMSRQEKPKTYTSAAAPSAAYQTPATGVAVNRSA
ncbi:MAG: flagellar protein FlgN [Pseudomonadota bacterium]